MIDFGFHAFKYTLSAFQNTLSKRERDIDMRSYYRVMLGAQSAHAAEARTGSFIGADYGIDQDLTNELTER